jgi:hypothetical protein
VSRSGGVRFDLSTAILHHGQPYPVASLGPGDVVNLHVQEVAGNTLYASRIDVVRLAWDEAAAALASPAREEARGADVLGRQLIGADAWVPYDAAERRRRATSRRRDRHLPGILAKRGLRLRTPHRVLLRPPVTGDPNLLHAPTRCP